MNTQITTQINQFLPLFLCSVSLIFYKLFCNSSLPLSVQQVCSASTFSVILLCFNLLCYSALPPNFTLHICSISYCASSPFPFLQFHSFSSRTANLSHSVSFSFIHTSPTVPLRISLGKTRTTVLATETLTDSQS
jgi:hypothetical protein